MATERDDEVVSDTETPEGPVREQFKKASISMASGAVDAVTAKSTAADAEHSYDDTDSSAPRGRLQKKRSIDEVEEEQAHDSSSESARQHTRKRSRDSTAEEDELNNGQRKSGERSRDVVDPESHSASNGHPPAPTSERPRTPEPAGGKRGEAAVESMTSPKSKRSRLQSGNEENDTVEAESATAASTDSASVKIPRSSGFANTSAASPFTSLSGSKSPSAEQQTSTKAFAASGFSSLSGSNSGFGAIGKTSGGFGTGDGFGTNSKSVSSTAETTTVGEGDESPKTASGSTFGGALGQKSTFGTSATGSNGSAFGSSASGFGKLGGSSGLGGSVLGGGSATAFGSIGGGGLNSFASGKPSASLTPAQSAKPFGTPGRAEDEDEDGGEGEDESGFKSPLSQESDKQDERFYKQDLETGEEDEVTEYSCRAKLYNFAIVGEAKKEWKERGLGVVRLNVKKPSLEDDEAKPTARLLMRAEGSHRVILNTQVQKEITFGAPKGGPPTSGYLYFMGAIDGKKGLEMLQLKVRQQFALELYEKVVELQEAM